MFNIFSEVSDIAKPVTAHSIQRIRALFDREKSDNQHPSHHQQHYIHTHPTPAISTTGGTQLKQSIVSGSYQKPNDQHYYSSAATGDREEDPIKEGQASSADTLVAPDSIKEGWLNCKVSNIDGKVAISMKDIRSDYLQFFIKMINCIKSSELYFTFHF